MTIIGTDGLIIITCAGAEGFSKSTRDKLDAFLDKHKGK